MNEVEYTERPYKPRTIFWNVDTQYDFMRSDESFKGALAVPGARGIEKRLEHLTRIADRRYIPIVNTADWHTPKSKEISATPDYVTTFPPHCMQGTQGAEYIPATMPGNRRSGGKMTIVEWDRTEPLDPEEIAESLDVIIHKDLFDAFAGNKHTDEIVKILNPYTAFVYGVATNYCVTHAVDGLVKRGVEVYVVKDAVKEIPFPGEPDATFKRWSDAGVKFIDTKDIELLWKDLPPLDTSHLN